jgi:hypothetical protein
MRRDGNSNSESMASAHDDQEFRVLSDFSTALIIKVLHTSIRTINAIRTVANSVWIVYVRSTDLIRPMG